MALAQSRLTRNVIAALLTTTSTALAEPVRVQFSTTASPTSIEHAACALDAVAHLGEESRPIDISIANDAGTRPCSSKNITDPIEVSIRVRGSEVTILTEAAPEHLAEIRNVAGEIRRELERRTSPPPRAKPTKKAFSPILMGTGIVVAAAGVGIVAGTEIWGVTHPTQTIFDPSFDSSVAAFFTGMGLALVGATLIVIGAWRVPIEN
jgi:hypothetical protein